MFFTLDDFKKIENYLKLNSMKDTDFNIVLEVSDLDYVALVLGSENVIVKLRDLKAAILNGYIPNVDGTTLWILNGAISLACSIWKVPDEQIHDDSIQAIYEFRDLRGNRIGDQIIIEKLQIDLELILQILSDIERIDGEVDSLSETVGDQQDLIDALEELQQKYIITDESTYESLSSYVKDAIYLVLEDEDTPAAQWGFGDTLPIILSGGWKLGGNLPIILA